MTGVIHADLINVKAEIAALADCLGRLTLGNLENNTLRGLSLFAWHIAGDADNVLREIETLNSELPRRPGRG
jgi:tRNA(Phe) wybutosine-synthesizing methylase Tyw3